MSETDPFSYIHSCELKAATMNRSQAIFSKGRINSALWKTLGLLFFVFTSCSRDEQFKNDILGEWKYEGVFFEGLKDSIKFNEQEIKAINSGWSEQFTQSYSWIFSEMQNIPKYKNPNEFEEIGEIYLLNVIGDTILYRDYKVDGNELEVLLIDSDLARLSINKHKIVKLDSRELILKNLQPNIENEVLIKFTKD